MWWADRWARIGSTAYVIAGLWWAYLSGQPAPAWLAAAWMATVGAVGLRVPGLANQVSLGRAYLAAPALVYAMTPGDLGLLAVTVALAGLTDLVDGTIARRTKQISNLGGGLDPVVDGIFLGAVAAGLVVGGALPLWLAAVVVARYLLPALAGGALLAAHRPVELRHTLMGQVSTTLILVLLGGIALFRGLNQDPGNLVAASEIVIPFATLATFIHLGLAVRRPVRARGDA